MEEKRPGLPQNWAQMTPDEKKQWRFQRFLDPPEVQFVSPAARAAYQTRARRTLDAYSVKEPDRVPVSLPVGDLPYNLYGISCYTGMYEPEKAVEACKEFNQKYSAELEYWASPFTTPAKALDILDYKAYAWPGHGLSVDAPGYQFRESEYMKEEEYDDLLRDPSDFWLRTFMPRIFGEFKPFASLPPLTDMIEMASGQLGVLADPNLRNTLRKLIEAGDELEQRGKIIGPHLGQGPANGFPMAMGALALAPFDILGDTLRGTTAIMKDMYRRPEKILAAVDVLADIEIHSLLHAPNFADMLLVMFPLHKGADGWMSQKQFDLFYLPSLKKVMDALIDQGIMVSLFAEGAYNTRLEAVTVFPKGTVCWYFDQTDMAKAKKVLGANCCIMGNVPSSMIVTGSPEDVKEQCRKLIETCAPCGGYILAAGCVAENPKLENLRAMLEAVQEYGIYQK